MRLFGYALVICFLVLISSCVAADNPYIDEYSSKFPSGKFSPIPGFPISIPVTVVVNNPSSGEEKKFWVGYSVKPSGTNNWFDAPPKQTDKIRRGGQVSVKLSWTPPSNAPTNTNYDLRVALWRGYDGRYMNNFIGQVDKPNAFYLGY